ncbi:hypothetical protein LTR37_014932 [Vermiconidia calcicola]|uniref:Uncharacterized protein n=1 Tax=Vermiconidia calcicola TaxID=1690605 RepID=A0ACC3MS14_9PEZI|nr:hypothetical protein LTR37_014932 [Vermiconidia calcicola]
MPCQICEAVAERLGENYVSVKVGQYVNGFGGIPHHEQVGNVELVDYTGPGNITGFYSMQEVQLDVQAYLLKTEADTEQRRSINQSDEEEMPQARILPLPNVLLNEAWNSLVFDDALPARLLRYIVRMVGMMSQPDLNLSTFNWNRLCLLHGPPGSGKSTLCRALVQKLSIRLGNVFDKSVLIEINTNAMLSKYFGESGKLIGSTFEKIFTMAQDPGILVCVVMDEVETIAGSREKSTNGMECNDGLRATNQLLTALDRLRNLPNVIVLCTSNLIDAIDPAFVDRVDIKQLIPSPSPAAIYNIFRSCLNELVRSNLVDSAVQFSERSSSSRTLSSSPRKPATRSGGRKVVNRNTSASSPSEPWTIVSPPIIPTFSDMKVRFEGQPDSPACRVWALAQKCHGFSGRTLRRLPILGLAMYTWGGDCTLQDAVSALEAAVEQELAVIKGSKRDIQMART